MIPMEVLSMAGGALGGFLMKAWSMAQENRQKQFEMFLGAIKARDDSMDKAIQRVPNDKAGNWIRRFIVISVLMGVIFIPFYLALSNKGVIVEVQTPVKDWLFFKTGGKTVFYQLGGYLLSRDLFVAFSALIGFYFGQGAAKAK
jgi:hypothetical protein